MTIQVYGLDYLTPVMNWFNNWQTILLFTIITGLLIYFFYRVNLSNDDSCLDAMTHYGFNFALLIVYGLCLFLVSRYIQELSFFYSIVLTILFYSINITILTIVLLFLRRWKIKRWILSKIEVLNNLKKIDKKTSDIVQGIRYICIHGDHQYLNEFLDDIHYKFISKTADTNIIQIKKIMISYDKYDSINIFEDKNKKPKK